jgi:uncharacterized protein YecT (DUF1311 family)
LKAILFKKAFLVLLVSSWILLIRSGTSSAMECEDALSNMAMIECEKHELDIANKTLSDLLQELKKHLTAEERKTVDRGQAGWLIYRNAHCESVVETYGAGSGGPLAGFKCEADLTKERIGQLRKAFSSTLTSRGKPEESNAPAHR